MTVLDIILFIWITLTSGVYLIYLLSLIINIICRDIDINRAGFFDKLKSRLDHIKEFLKRIYLYPN